IALLLFLVMKVKLQAFVALLIASLFIGVASGMDLTVIIESIESGMGGTLGFIAVVVGLGSMFGELLKVSGGAERLALTMLNKFGEKRAPWALGITGFFVSIPVFLDVALVILVPIIYSLTQKTKKSLFHYGIPLLAGLAVTHAFVLATAGPLFGKYIGEKIHVEVPDFVQLAEDGKEVKNEKELPGFFQVISLIAIPLVLILVNTMSDLLLTEGTLAHSFLTFIGDPFV